MPHVERQVTAKGMCLRAKKSARVDPRANGGAHHLAPGAPVNTTPMPTMIFPTMMAATHWRTLRPSEISAEPMVQFEILTEQTSQKPAKDAGPHSRRAGSRGTMSLLMKAVDLPPGPSLTSRRSRRIVSLVFRVASLSVMLLWRMIYVGRGLRMRCRLSDKTAVSSKIPFARLRDRVEARER